MAEGVLRFRLSIRHQHPFVVRESSCSLSQPVRMLHVEYSSALRLVLVKAARHRQTFAVLEISYVLPWAVSWLHVR